MTYEKESERVYRLHHARFKSLFGGMDLAALHIRHIEAKKALLTVGLTDETCAKCDALLGLIETREAIAKNPHYEELQRACEALSQFDAEVRKLGASIHKAFREISKAAKRIEVKIGRMNGSPNHS
jgi:hypothetical protein